MGCHTWYRKPQIKGKENIQKFLRIVSYKKNEWRQNKIAWFKSFFSRNPVPRKYDDWFYCRGKLRSRRDLGVESAMKYLNTYISSPPQSRKTFTMLRCKYLKK